MPEMALGASVVPTIALRLSSGANQFGQTTMLNGASIDFGLVTFTHPERVANGAAYLEQGNLRLEAVTLIETIFSGANAVAIDLSQLPLTDGAFHRVYYSTSTNRSVTPDVVSTHPQKDRIDTVTSGQTNLNIRLVMEITPQQSGRLYSRLRMEAQAL
jgi:hypothetical protein